MEFSTLASDVRPEAIKQKKKRERERGEGWFGGGGGGVLSRWGVMAVCEGNTTTAAAAAAAPVC